MRNLIDTWLAAQNQGDFARYQALYAERFEGIKRTADFIPELAIDLDAVGRWELLGNQASTLLEPAEAYESGPAIGITALDCPC